MKILYRVVDGGLTSVGTREFEGTAATSELQGDGFALAMSGANLSRFKNGGPLLFNHDTTHQVGRVTSIRTTATALVFRATFPSAGISKHADETCGLVKEGILSGISLGFGVDEAEPINPQRPRDGTLATAWTAYEISLVPVPLDINATVTARSLHRGGALDYLRGMRNRTPEERSLIAAAAENGETLTATRIAVIVAEARRLGQSPEYHFRWQIAARDRANNQGLDYLRRQAALRELAP